jgi:hypothetical protein
MPRSRSSVLESIETPSSAAPHWRKQSVGQGGLAVVDVRNDGDVADFHKAG